MRTILLTLFGVWAMHAAAANGYSEIVETLATSGASMDLRNKKKETALEVAHSFAQDGTYELLKRLRDSASKAGQASAKDEI